MRILDTPILIDLQREWARGRRGPAYRYLSRRHGEEFRISVMTALEFLEAYAQPADGERFLEPFPRLEVTEKVAEIGSRIRRSLRQAGEMIGEFDILIAATAIAADLPLVTDNARHFAQVDGLVVETYRAPQRKRMGKLDPKL